MVDPSGRRQEFLFNELVFFTACRYITDPLHLNALRVCTFLNINIVRSVFLYILKYFRHVCAPLWLRSNTLITAMSAYHTTWEAENEDVF